MKVPVQQGLLKRVHPWCRTGKTELKFEPGKSAAADIQRLQLRRHKPQPRTVTGAGAKEGGRELSSRTPRIRVGVSSCCEHLPPTRCRSPEPPRNQTSARGLRPGTPPPHPPPPRQVPPPGTVSRGDGLDLHAHHGPTGPASKGSSRLPRPRLRSGPTPQALRLPFLPPLQSRRRCGWSQDLRGEGPPGRGRRGGAARQGGVGRGGARGKRP